MQEHDERDRLKSIKRPNNLIDGEVDVGDYETVWSFPPELLVELSTPNAKAKKAYRGGSVSMLSDITDKVQRNYLFYVGLKTYLFSVS